MTLPRDPSKPVVPDKTRDDQRRAADPGAAAGVAANAGSGKTKVLVDRVLRLLLSGANPARILCLTFTRAAAATMTNRVFAELARWVTLDTLALSKALEALTGATPSAAMQARARRLFAYAVETPGGLKIETIHAFCERVLHLFPFEANVPARFSVLDETSEAALVASARRNVLLKAASGRDPSLSTALTQLAREVSDDALDAALDAVMCSDGLLHRAALPDMREHLLGMAARAMGLAPGETAASVTADMLDNGLLADDLRTIVNGLRSSPNVKTDGALADQLIAAAAAKGDERLARYSAAFFTKEGRPCADKFVTTKAPSDIAEALRAERDRLAPLMDKLRAAAAIARTRNLLILADAMMDEVTRTKRERALLSFDDLIRRTAALLARSDAAWVLYKLDAGIDHLLVDESQDNNPAQWDILDRLVAEFTAGKGTREHGPARTMFAVGDPKQSIYGFQGAAPGRFGEILEAWKGRSVAIGLPFQHVELTLSFRSAASILTGVDAVFSQVTAAHGLTFLAGEKPPPHQSAWPDMPGRIDIWELARPAERAEAEAWSRPVDEPDARAPAVVLAERVARFVARLINGENGQAKVPPGEILILVRKRGVAFEATLKALKDAQVPVAGADRIELASHIAVQDVIAIAQAALLPQDDLTLATALTTPIGGLDQEGLLAIAAERGEGVSLMAALATAAEAGDERARAANAKLTAWRAMAVHCGPFRFITTLLGPMGGRRALISRLGAEAGDAIDALVARVLAFERQQAPSLAAFVAMFGMTLQNKKRDLEAQAREVRVMTVHGAKGLEAQVVILLDGSTGPGGATTTRLVPIPVAGQAPVPIWFPRKADEPAITAEPREHEKRLAAAEHNRLLYVAMTRAKQHLVIAPYIGRTPKDPPEDCWHQMIAAGLATSALPRSESRDVANTFAMTSWGEADLSVNAATTHQTQPVILTRPVWLDQSAPPEPEAAPPLRPSGAGAAADRAPRTHEGPLAADRRLAGTLVHALIERLPEIAPERRSATAMAYLAARGARLPEALRVRLAQDALAILAHPELAPLFGPDSRAEAAVAGTIAFGPDGTLTAVSGQIDRMAVTAEAVYLADMKTTARAPVRWQDAPASHVMQLAIYAALLRQLYPDRAMQAVLVYTAGPAVIPVPEAVLKAALTGAPAAALMHGR